MDLERQVGLRGNGSVVVPDRRAMIRSIVLKLAAMGNQVPELVGDAEVLDLARDLFARYREQSRLLYDAWWLDDAYSYNKIPFRPVGLDAEELEHRCVEARRAFYSWPSILRRSADPVNRASAFMFRNFFLINALHRADVAGRNHYPLGDQSWSGRLLPAV